MAFASSVLPLIGERASADSQKQKDDSAMLRALVIALPVALTAVIVLLAFLLWRQCRRTRTLAGSVRPPGVGPQTTLLVTDIVNSTVLWETLAAVAMDRAVRLHHGCLRRLLRPFNGYESATEGDCFILAFHAPADAARYALAAQMDLLDQPWPEELLRHPDACEVWVRCPPSRRSPFEVGVTPKGMDEAFDGLGGGMGMASATRNFDRAEERPRRSSRSKISLLQRRFSRRSLCGSPRGSGRARGGGGGDGDGGVSPATSPRGASPTSPFGAETQSPSGFSRSLVAAIAATWRTSYNSRATSGGGGDGGESAGGNGRAVLHDSEVQLVQRARMSVTGRLLSQRVTYWGGAGQMYGNELYGRCSSREVDISVAGGVQGLKWESARAAAGVAGGGGGHRAARMDGDSAVAGRLPGMAMYRRSHQQLLLPHQQHQTQPRPMPAHQPRPYPHYPQPPCSPPAGAPMFQRLSEGSYLGPTRPPQHGRHASMSYQTSGPRGLPPSMGVGGGSHLLPQPQPPQQRFGSIISLPRSSGAGADASGTPSGTPPIGSEDGLGLLSSGGSRASPPSLGCSTRQQAAPPAAPPLHEGDLQHHNPASGSSAPTAGRDAVACGPGAPGVHMRMHAEHSLEEGAHGQPQEQLRHGDEAHVAASALQASGVHGLGRQGLTGAAMVAGVAERPGEGAGSVLGGGLGAAVGLGDAVQRLPPPKTPVAAEASVGAAAAAPDAGRQSGCATCSDEEGTVLSDSALLPQMPYLPDLGPLRPVAAPEALGAPLEAGVQPGRGPTKPALRLQDGAAAAAAAGSGSDSRASSLQCEPRGGGPKAATCVGPVELRIATGRALPNAAAATAATEAEVAKFLPSPLAVPGPGLPSPPPNAAATPAASCDAAQDNTNDSFPPTIFTLHGYVSKAIPPAQALAAVGGVSPYPPRLRARRTSTPPGTGKGTARVLAGVAAGAPSVAVLAGVTAGSTSVGAPAGVGQRHRAASCEVHPSWGLPSSGESSSDALLADGGRQGTAAGRDGEPAGRVAERRSSRQLWRAALGRVRERIEQAPASHGWDAIAEPLQPTARLSRLSRTQQDTPLPTNSDSTHNSSSTSRDAFRTQRNLLQFSLKPRTIVSGPPSPSRAHRRPSSSRNILDRRRPEPLQIPAATEFSFRMSDPGRDHRAGETSPLPKSPLGARQKAVDPSGAPNTAGAAMEPERDTCGRQPQDPVMLSGPPVKVKAPAEDGWKANQHTSCSNNNSGCSPRAAPAAALPPPCGSPASAHTLPPPAAAAAAPPALQPSPLAPVSRHHTIDDPVSYSPRTEHVPAVPAFQHQLSTGSILAPTLTQPTRIAPASRPPPPPPNPTSHSHSPPKWSHSGGWHGTVSAHHRRRPWQCSSSNGSPMILPIGIGNGTARAVSLGAAAGVGAGLVGSTGAGASSGYGSGQDGEVGSPFALAGDAIDPRVSGDESQLGDAASSAQGLLYGGGLSGVFDGVSEAAARPGGAGGLGAGASLVAADSFRGSKSLLQQQQQQQQMAGVMAVGRSGELGQQGLQAGAPAAEASPVGQQQRRRTWAQLLQELFPVISTTAASVAVPVPELCETAYGGEPGYGQGAVGSPAGPWGTPRGAFDTIGEANEGNTLYEYEGLQVGRYEEGASVHAVVASTYSIRRYSYERGGFGLPGTAGRGGTQGHAGAQHASAAAAGAAPAHALYSGWRAEDGSGGGGLGLTLARGDTGGGAAWGSMGRKKDRSARYSRNGLAAPRGDGGPALAFRGLRVRMGLHSGISSPADVRFNPTTGSVAYTGVPLRVAKAVSDCAAGGMVLATERCLHQLLPILHMLDSRPPLAVYCGDVELEGLPSLMLTAAMASTTGMAAAEVTAAAGGGGGGGGGGGRVPLAAAALRKALSSPQKPPPRPPKAPLAREEAHPGNASAPSAGVGGSSVAATGGGGQGPSSSLRQQAILGRELLEADGADPAPGGTCAAAGEQASAGAGARASRHGAHVAAAGACVRPGAVRRGVALFQLVGHRLKQRLPHLEALRGVAYAQLGNADAPAGRGVAIAFLSVPSAHTLVADLEEVGVRALALVKAVLLSYCTELGGYVIEASEGMCLAAFHDPTAAAVWALDSVEALKQHPWPDALLRHPTCTEELARPASPLTQPAPNVIATLTHKTTSTTTTAPTTKLGASPPHHASKPPSNPTPPQPAVLPPPRPFLHRGPRLRVGLHVGEVSCDVHSSTGRLSYRGRVMNRAARIAYKARDGQVLCSRAAWSVIEAQLPAASAAEVDRTSSQRDSGMSASTVFDGIGGGSPVGVATANTHAYLGVQRLCFSRPSLPQQSMPPAPALTHGAGLSQGVAGGKGSPACTAARAMSAGCNALDQLPSYGFGEQPARLRTAVRPTMAASSRVAAEAETATGAAVPPSQLSPSHRPAALAHPDAVQLSHRAVLVASNSPGCSSSNLSAHGGSALSRPPHEAPIPRPQPSTGGALTGSYGAPPASPRSPGATCRTACSTPGGGGGGGDGSFHSAPRGPAWLTPPSPVGMAPSPAHRSCNTQLPSHKSGQLWTSLPLSRAVSGLPFAASAGVPAAVDPRVRDSAAAAAHAAAAAAAGARLFGAGGAAGNGTVTGTGTQPTARGAATPPSCRSSISATSGGGGGVATSAGGDPWVGPAPASGTGWQDAAYEDEDGTVADAGPGVAAAHGAGVARAGAVGWGQQAGAIGDVEEEVEEEEGGEDVLGLLKKGRGGRQLQAKSLGSFQLKGISEPVELMQLRWSEQGWDAQGPVA